jgi:VWFA-related protein
MANSNSSDLSRSALLFIFTILAVFVFNGSAQQPATEPTPVIKKKKEDKKNRVRTVTIPISIFTKEELREGQLSEIVEAGNIFVKEDGDDQTILSIRSVTNSPLSLAVLVQDDLDTNVNLELKRIAEFILQLPKGSKVMVGYIRGGSLNVQQKFTDDLEKAAKSLRIVSGSSFAAPVDPYDNVADALGKFEALPLGRRAVLLISDGLDASNGIANSTPGESLSLDRAILKAQRKSIAVYSFYSAGSLTKNASSRIILNGQGSLNKLSEETGGRAFFQGTSSPISFDPFFKDLNLMLNRQFALTYLSTHVKKGFHKVQVYSSNPAVKIDHPNGYYYR